MGVKLFLAKARYSSSSAVNCKCMNETASREEHESRGDEGADGLGGHLSPRPMILFCYAHGTAGVKKSPSCKIKPITSAIARLDHPRAVDQTRQILKICNAPVPTFSQDGVRPGREKNFKSQLPSDHYSCAKYDQMVLTHSVWVEERVLLLCDLALMIS